MNVFSQSLGYGYDCFWYWITWIKGTKMLVVLLLFMVLTKQTYNTQDKHKKPKDKYKKPQKLNLTKPY